MITIFSKNYDGESLYDLGRDIGEALEAPYNPIIDMVPRDEHGFQKGSFKVFIEWFPEEEL